MGYFAIALASPVALVAAPLAAYLAFGRPARRDLVLAAALVGVVVGLTTGSADGFGRIERAWVFLLGGGVVVALAQRPTRTFVSTALTAIGCAALAAALLMLATGLSWREVEWATARHFGYQVRTLLEGLWRRQAVTGVPAPALLEALEGPAAVGIKMVSRLLPALLLLQSLAALAMAWSLYQRVAREPQGEPLGRLREFRFNDNLIWGVVAALVVLVLPRLGWVSALGGNLVVFFGGLYVLRGLGVVAALAAAGGIGGPFAVVAGAFIALLLTPLAALAALAFGVTDTWVDWRRLVRVARPK